MIEKIKTYKYGYKCIAMLLVFALSLNMLAGCGKSGSVNNTVQDEYKTENTAPEKDTEKESVDSQENTMPASELLGTELDTLEEQVKSGNVEETATHLYAVEEAFGQMAEEAEEIIREQFPDCAGKINWPDVKTHASPFSILKQTLKIASCDLDKKFVIKQYNQIRDGLRNELFHGKGTGNVDIIKLKNAIIAYEWLYENFQKEINKPRN